MDLNCPISVVKGVGPVLAAKLAQAGISSVQDALQYLPRQYSDYSATSSIAAMRPGLVTIVVKFENITQRQVRRGMHITQADATDNTGKVRVVWFRQPYRAAQLDSSLYYVLRGKFELTNSRLQITNPSVERQADIPIGTTIMPTYPEKSGLKSHQIRKIMVSLFAAHPVIPESLPADLLKTHQLMPLAAAYKQLHAPDSHTQLEAARRRFAFEELFIVMFAADIMRQTSAKTQSVPIEFNKLAAKAFVDALPFTMTNEQRAVSWKIMQDMQSSTPMNRLIEGDVGTGKTVVAAMASLMVLTNNKQVALIAPTELLAKQHYQTFKDVLAHTNYAKDIVLLVGSTKKSEKQAIKTAIKNHAVRLIIGTHALLEEDIDWHSLGLIIIDEQHRFGVKQRQKLHTKATVMPHVLCMTATPIPRSLALTVYGELNISIITQKPLLKPPITTKIVSPNSVAQMYHTITASLQAGRQAYIVCPLIAQSTVLNAPNAEQTYEQVRTKYLANFRIGLLHGKMTASEKDEVMKRFKDHQIDALVTTTVIEVGVDVPNATDMVILGADRFGLAQLHQLRGRVGRGEHAGSCYLVLTDSQKPSKRMQAIASTTNGFELAEYDLEIRGAGALYGTQQHGALDLRYVQLTDHKLIAEVRQAVQQYNKNTSFMVKYPYIAGKIHKTLQLTYLN